MKSFKSLGFLLCLMMSSSLACAHPTSYEGGFALMSEQHPEMQEVSVVYSPKYWFGLGLVNMRASDEFELVTTQAGWLVNRWNQPGAQGNFYLLCGLGYGKLEASSFAPQKEGFIYRVGAQADYETRRVYTFLRYVEHRFTGDGNFFNNQFTAAFGLAPYLGKFDELNSWVIFKMIVRNEFEDFIYIPVLRFFYKNLLWEVGQDFNGNSQFNFMVRF